MFKKYFVASILAGLTSLCLLVSNVSAESVVSFRTAKNKVYKQVYNNSGQTIYCGCDWSDRKVDLKSCGLQSLFKKSQRVRSNRTEIEHVIPISWANKKNGEWRQCAIEAKLLKTSARKHCQDTDMDYKQAHNDIVNLFPAIGQINSDRSNKPFVEAITQKKKTYGKCAVQSGSRGFIPPEKMRGDISRIAFYMHEKYGISYSKRQMNLFVKWNKQDPISIEEANRNRRIVTLQGYGLIQ